MNSEVIYYHLKPLAQLPKLHGDAPFKAVILVESEVEPDWQIQVSDWLVGSGCLYALACGLSCSEWDDFIDFANVKQFDGKEIPNNGFVMTTWHENEPLIDVFEFAKNLAIHPTVELEKTILIHISLLDNEDELLRLYYEA